jgi:hypothetical protein
MINCKFVIADRELQMTHMEGGEIYAQIEIRLSCRLFLQKVRSGEWA